MVRAAGGGPKFSAHLRDQQLANPDLHFVSYRQLDRAIGSGRDPPPVDTVNFVEAVNAEICLVNTCFERRRLELLQSIAGLRHMLQGKDPEKATELAPELALGGLNGDGDSEFWQRALTCLVEVLDGLTRLRDYAVWNCHAVSKIHRRWSKQMPSDVVDKNLQTVIQNLQADGANEWLQQLRFFDGLEFAEMYIAIDSLQEACLELSPSRQGTPERPSPKLWPRWEEDATHSLTSSGSDWLPSDLAPDTNIIIDSSIVARPSAPGPQETYRLAVSKDVAAASPTQLEAECVITEATVQCIACLAEIAPSLQSDAKSPTTQFGCGHRLCLTCCALGRPSHPNWQGKPCASPDVQAMCAICRKDKDFSPADSIGIRRFRGVLTQFLFNLFVEKSQQSSLCQGEQREVVALAPTAATLTKNVDCSLSVS